MPPIERQASVIPDRWFFTRIPARSKQKRLRRFPARERNRRSLGRCETMQRVLEYPFEAGRLDMLEQRRSRRQFVLLSEHNVEGPVTTKAASKDADGFELPRRGRNTLAMPFVNCSFARGSVGTRPHLASLCFLLM